MMSVVANIEYILIPSSIAGAGAVVGFVVLIFKVAAWYSNVNTDRSSFREFIQQIKGDMKEIRDDIKGILHRLPTLTVAGDSPLRLTDFGLKLADDIEAEAWAERCAPKLQVAGLEPFEVDDVCAKYVHDSLDDDMDGAVSRCAYESGIEREDVLAVLRVVLRDAVLEHHATQSAPGT